MKVLSLLLKRKINEKISLHQPSTLNSSNKILLEGAQEGLLLLGGLESTVTKLGRGVDPFELGLLGGPPVDLGVEGLAQGHDTLLNTRNGALEEEEVVLDLTVADETTHAISLLVYANSIHSHGGTYGVICFLEMSNSVEALPSSEPFPTRKTLWLHEVRWW